MDKSTKYWAAKAVPAIMLSESPRETAVARIVLNSWYIVGIAKVTRSVKTQDEIPEMCICNTESRTQVPPGKTKVPLGKFPMH